jgi:hypothetical protein
MFLGANPAINFRWDKNGAIAPALQVCVFEEWIGFVRSREVL